MVVRACRPRPTIGRPVVVVTIISCCFNSIPTIVLHSLTDSSSSLIICLTRYLSRKAYGQSLKASVLMGTSRSRPVPKWVPKNGKAKRTDISKAGFLDLKTLLWAEFHKSVSLKSACELKAFKKHDLPQKDDYTPTGQVIVAEIEYGRHDVRCTAALLNAAKQEFDLHPTSRRPDNVYSPASFVKSYFDEMGIIPPAEKRGAAHGTSKVQRRYRGTSRSPYRLPPGDPFVRICHCFFNRASASRDFTSFGLSRNT